jgi:predicted ATP-grasp superfamily ATP-dependent carboligase
MSAIESYRIYQTPKLSKPSLIICWDEDAGGVGRGVFRYLNDKLNLSLFGEIEPGEFFPLSGVLVEDDVTKFPECKFYQCEEKNLIILKSGIPRFDWYKFVNTVLEISQQICKAKEIFTVGGIVSITAHTMPRLLMATMNKPELKTSLCDFDINVNMDYETPVGQRPTMSSYIVWEAMRRKIPGVSIWVPVPFYMISIEDVRACRRIVDFLSRNLELGINFSAIDKLLSEQNQAILRATEAFPEIMETIRKLETNNAVSETESAKLVEVIEEYLKAGENK